MALSSNNTTITAGASAFFASLFAARSPATHIDNNNEAEITDWEFVNNSDLSDDDCGLNWKIDDQDYGSLAVLGIRSTYGEVAEEKKKQSEQEEEEDLDEEIEDPESDDDEEDNDVLDDVLVPWSVSDRFGRQRMRKLGTRAFAKMNKTSKKFAYTVNRPGCVRGKHGLGRKAESIISTPSF